MAKPSGAVCNLGCEYCYFLSKERLYPGSRFRMSAATLERYVIELIASARGSEVTFAWQGGEPTLLGLDFYRRAVALQRRHAPPSLRVVNTFQTNGVLLDDDWCAFFREHDVLVGLSVDGPRDLHDAYRVDKGGAGTFDRVMRGYEALRRQGVEVNLLATVHAANQDHPLRVYRFLRDELDARFLQFIPIVERAAPSGFQEGTALTERSVDGAAYGRFMSAIFDEWFARDVGTVFVQLFDVALGKHLGQPGLCVFEATCGDALALEHSGDVYSCDHYVEPDHRLGNLHELPLVALVDGARQRAFGEAKRTTLPRQCRECEVRWLCNGGCPKDRVATTRDGEAGLSHLCDGYYAFFTHSAPVMWMMARSIAGR